MRVLGGASGLNCTYFFRHENAYRDASQADDVIGGSKFAGEITLVRTRITNALADDPTGFELKRCPSPRRPQADVTWSAYLAQIVFRTEERHIHSYGYRASGNHRAMNIHAYDGKNTMVQKISRRHVAQLFLLGIAGAGVSQYLRKTSPIGRDVRSNETAQAALEDKTSPSHEVAQPTLTLVLFTDYRCPACRLSNAAMEAALLDDEHVRVVYRDWPIFGALSQRAAQIAIAADRQGIYPKLHSQLMSERRVLDEDILRQAVENSGGTWAQIENDLQTHAADIERQLDRNRQDAFQLSISGTPTYLSGSILVSGAQDQAAFRKLFAAGRATMES